ncbi:25247_t:CDS:2 [Gigaspora margarita]|uniref:25247_t:CDS:1 n=1 Tax=Gigaspora margarita TaxID=4874 RepID=A0ABN7UZL5_GIGMA|nr:25247_t:CDS:2 [Gigaspora margarita]
MRSKNRIVKNKIVLRTLEELVDNEKRIARYNRCKENNTKGEKYIIKINRMMEVYKLMIDCKKRLRANIKRHKKTTKKK